MEQWYWEPNYYLQNEVYLKELLRRHGKDIEFVGVVFANNVMKIDGKDTMGMMAATLCKETLKADCVIINKSGMGHCQLDSALAFNWAEKMGMTCVMNLSAVSNDKPGDMLVISDSKIDAVVNSGRNYREGDWRGNECTESDGSRCVWSVYTYNKLCLSGNLVAVRRLLCDNRQ